MITRMNSFIFEQLLPTNTTTNVWQPVRRIDILTPGFKGLNVLKESNIISCGISITVTLLTEHTCGTSTADMVYTWRQKILDPVKPTTKP